MMVLGLNKFSKGRVAVVVISSATHYARFSCLDANMFCCHEFRGDTISAIATKLRDFVR